MLRNDVLCSEIRIIIEIPVLRKMIHEQSQGIYVIYIYVRYTK